MRSVILTILLFAFCQLALAQTSVKPTADPLALTEIEAVSLDKNQQQGVVLKDEETRVRKTFGEAADKILTAKNADAMSAAGYQMRDALAEDLAYRNKLNTHNQATDALVEGIRSRYQQQTGLDCSQCTINVQTKRLQPNIGVTQGQTANPEQKPVPKARP